MKVKTNRKTLGTAALLFGLVIGGAGISAAATGNLPSGKESNDGPEQTYVSSVKADKGSSLDGLAKLSADQAATAASSIGGTAGTAVLENEDGNVVYVVEVTKTSGEKVDVAIDAGNGAVLGQEAGDNETNDGPDGQN